MTKGESSVGEGFSWVVWTSGIPVVVVDWGSSNIVWETDGEFTTWVDVTEKNIGECVSSLLGWVELLD